MGIEVGWKTESKSVQSVLKWKQEGVDRILVNKEGRDATFSMPRVSKT